jgi:hypothetical protein
VPGGTPPEPRRTHDGRWFHSWGQTHLPRCSCCSTLNASPKRQSPRRISDPPRTRQGCARTTHARVHRWKEARELLWITFRVLVAMITCQVIPPVAHKRRGHFGPVRISKRCASGNPPGLTNPEVSVHWSCFRVVPQLLNCAERPICLLTVSGKRGVCSSDQPRRDTKGS